MDPSKNIIKDNNERNTLLYKNISLILFSKRSPHFVVSWEIDGETIYSERGVLFISCLLPGARGCQRLHSLASQDASARLRVKGSTPILCTLSKSACVVRITWSPSGYTPVGPNCPDRAVLFTNHNVIACQSSWGHWEQTKNPCHVLYNRIRLG